MRLESETTLENSDSFNERPEDPGYQRTTEDTTTTTSGTSYGFPDGSDGIVSYIDTMSLDSDTLQDFGSLVTLPPGTISGLFRSVDMGSDEGSQTILSSEPSNISYPLPEPAQAPWTGSPHPLLASESMRSISTVCTDIVPYEDLLRVTGTHQNDEALRSK